MPRHHSRVKIGNLLHTRYSTVSATGAAFLEDLSAGGLLLSQAPAEALPQPGETIEVRITLREQSFIIQGHVANVDTRRIGIRVSPTSAATLSAIARSLVNLPGEVNGGVVEVVSPNELRIKGALSFPLRQDLAYYLDQGRFRTLDLSCVDRIDLSGVALCTLARDTHGVQITHCSPPVRPVMLAVGVCHGCPRHMACHEAPRSDPK